MLEPAVLLFTFACFFAIAAIYFFFRNERETKKLLSAEDKLEHIANREKSKLMSVIGGLTDGVIVLDSAFVPWVINASSSSTRRTFIDSNCYEFGRIDSNEFVGD